MDPQFISVTYVDDKQILGFNSRSESQRLESWAPWMNEQNPEFWEKATQDSLNEKLFLTEIMRKVLHIYNYSMTGE